MRKNGCIVVRYTHRAGVLLKKTSITTKSNQRQLVSRTQWWGCLLDQ